MKAYPYDFHIHSCLSPCGDNEMTPGNLVNMALLSGCEIIALTDHNSCKNTPAAVRAGREVGLLVIPGMELCVQEEAHVVCLFETVEGALAFDEYVCSRRPPIPNRPEIFGEQNIMDENDNLLGTEENLLLTAAEIGLNEVLPLAERFGGTAFPAHIDRDSYSVTASLGAIPPEAGFRTAEVTRGCDLEALCKANPEVGGLFLVRDSDSHYLETLASEPCRMELPEKSVRAVLERLRMGLDWEV